MYPSPSGFFVLLLSWPLATGTHMSRSVRSPSVAATCGVAENDSRRRRGATTATASYAFVLLGGYYAGYPLLSAAGPAACRHRGNDGSPRRALTRPTLHFPTVSVEQPIDQPAPADRLTDNARRTLARSCRKENLLAGPYFSLFFEKYKRGFIFICATRLFFLDRVDRQG
jgi:hypothetical protein